MVTNFNSIKNFCINLDRRPDRWSTVKKIFNDQDININRWSAIDAKQYGFSNPTGASCSHMGILYFCRLADIRYAMIFEDDVVLCHNFKDKLELILNIIPKDWDALSLHCFKAQTEKINDYICRLLSPIYGAHGILFNTHGINKILNSNDKMCIEDKYFKSLDSFYAINLEHTMAFQNGEDSDIPETSITNEYKSFYDKYKHLHS
jgi:GR25 family glycosyltransferase involved in LPS biosynthesis